MLNRRSFSDVLPESPKSARKKEEARQAEFVRIGQVGGFYSQTFCAGYVAASPIGTRWPPQRTWVRTLPQELCHLPEGYCDTLDSV